MKNLENIKALAEKLPKDVKANALALIDRMGTTIEGISDKPIEWKPELAKIIQGTSDRSKLPKGTPVGAIMVGENVIEQPRRVIPIRMWDGRQYWSPDQNEAKMICSSPDAKVGYIGYVCDECPHSKWVDGKSDCSRIKQVAVVNSDLSNFFIINFAKTNYINGKDWAGLMSKAMVQPYKRMYDLQTETHKEYKNVEIMTVSSTTDRTPTEYYDFLQALFDQFSADREAYLVAFHAMSLERGKANQAKLLENQQSVPALSETITVDSTAATETQTSAAAKYEL